MKQKKNISKKEKGKRIIKWIEEHQNHIVLSLIFLSMVILNCLTPYIFDDINYSYVWRTPEKIKNLWDIVVSQYKHYFSWGGRSIAHATAQFFLMYPKMFFNIANSICYVGILSKINSLATHKKKNAWMILFIHVLLFLTVPCFGEDFLWLIGMEFDYEKQPDRIVSLSDLDIRIINALKDDSDLYERFIEDPERTVTQISNLLNKK